MSEDQKNEISTEGVAQTPTTEMKPCPVCGEDIRATAKKCIKCQAEFGWKRYITTSSTTLALLTALISVLATVAPTVKNWLEQKDSRIIMSFLESKGDLSDGRASALVGNTGNRPGSATPRLFEFTFMRREYVSRHELGPSKRIYSVGVLLTTPDDRPLFVKSESTEVMNIVVDKKRPLITSGARLSHLDEVTKTWRMLRGIHQIVTPNNAVYDLHCFMSAEVFEFSGRSKLLTLNVPCNKITDIALDAIEQAKDTQDFHKQQDDELDRALYERMFGPG